MLGTVQEHPQIVPINPEIATHFILIAFFEKNLAEQAAVLFGQFFQNLSNLALHLFCRDSSHDVHRWRGKVLLFLIFQRGVARRRPILLQQDIVADRVHKGPKTLGLANAAFTAQSEKDSGKGFLAHVLDGLRRMEARAELQLNQFAEISHKMFLRAEVSFTETLDIGFVKGLELQGVAPRPLEWQ